MAKHCWEANLLYMPGIYSREAYTCPPSPPSPPPSLPLPHLLPLGQVRSTLQKLLTAWTNNDNASGPLQDLVLVTGTGSVAKPAPPTTPRLGDVDNRGNENVDGDSATESVGWRAQRYSVRSFSLRELLAEELRTAYDPPLRASSTTFMAGCLVVKGEDLETWAKAQHQKRAGDGE